MNPTPCSTQDSLKSVSVKLLDEEKWQEFYEENTEMIVNKQGRRMFPFITLHISELEPQEFYCVRMIFIPIGNVALKYSKDNGWIPGSEIENELATPSYLHPESPATGQHWMSRDLCFEKLKLTNDANSCNIPLPTRRKFQPQIVITKTMNPMAQWAPAKIISFHTTQFITVTAYQNQEIVNLKINHNKFAKGFRTDGRATSKRKRREQEKTENSNQSHTISSIQQVQSAEESDSKSDEAFSLRRENEQLLVVPVPPLQPVIYSPVRHYPQNPNVFLPQGNPYHNFYPMYHHVNVFMSPLAPQYMYRPDYVANYSARLHLPPPAPFNLHKLHVANAADIVRPVTDFSIKAIIGLK